jgi:hypothetical protein
MTNEGHRLSSQEIGLMDSSAGIKIIFILEKIRLTDTILQALEGFLCSLYRLEDSLSISSFLIISPLRPGVFIAC